MELLRAEHIKAGYEGKTVLRDISFSIRQGEFTALLGLNGTGKTTLLKAICGLIKPVAGKFIIHGEDSSHFDDKQRARHVSFMPQRHSIIYNTHAVDVVLMGITPYLGVFDSPTKAHRKLAYEMLDKMDIGDLADKNFLHLSEGQKQLVMISRSLMQNSEIMLFDEPDSALDFNNKHMVLSRLIDLVKQENKAGFITLHDPNFALNYCDRIIILNGGRIYAQFDTQYMDRMHLNEIFAEIYGNIDIIRHKEKYVMVRLADETGI